MEGGNVRFSMKRKGQYTAHVFFCEFCEIFKKKFFLEHIRATISEYSRIEFCVNIAQLIILSYPTTPRKWSLLRTPVLYSLLVQLLMAILILFI